MLFPVWACLVVAGYPFCLEGMQSEAKLLLLLCGGSGLSRAFLPVGGRSRFGKITSVVNQQVPTCLASQR